MGNLRSKSVLEPAAVDVAVPQPGTPVQNRGHAASVVYDASQLVGAFSGRISLRPINVPPLNLAHINSGASDLESPEEEKAQQHADEPKKEKKDKKKKEKKDKKDEPKKDNKKDHENKHDPKGDIKLAGEPEPHPEPPENIGRVQPLAPTSDGHRTCPYMSALAAPTAILATREPGSSAPATAPAQGLAQGKIPLSFFSSDDGITAAQGVLKKLEEAPAEHAKKRKSLEAATPVG